MSLTRRRLRGDAGAGTVEYIGIGAVVIVIVAALVMQVTPVGSAIASEICRAFGAECGSASAGVPGAEPIPEPTRACVLSSGTLTGTKSASISIIDGEDETQVVRDAKSNGDVTVTVLDAGTIGASLKAPGLEAELQVFGSGGSNKLKGDAGVGVRGASAATYTFSGPDAEQQADDFESYLAWTKGATEASQLGGIAFPGLSPIVGATVPQLGDALYRYFADYRPPSPSHISLEGGLVESGNLALNVGPLGGVKGDLKIAQSVGAKIHTETGAVTYYVKGSTSGSIKGEVGPSVPVPGTELKSSKLFGAEGQLAGAADLAAEVTVDADGQITGLAITGSLSGEYGGSVAQAFGTDYLDNYGSPLGVPIVEGGGKGTVRAQIAVTDANRDAVLSAMGELGLAATTSRNPVEAGAAAADPMLALLNQALATDGITRESADIKTEDIIAISLGGKLPGVGGVSVGVKAAYKSLQTTDAWYLGENGWEPWRNCVDS